MNCSDYTELISSLIDNMCTDSEKKDIEAHLSSCPLCMEKYRAMKSLADASPSLSQVDLPEGFQDDTIQNVFPSRSKKKFIFPSFVTNWKIYSGAVACVFALMLVNIGINQKYNAVYEDSADYTYISKNITTGEEEMRAVTEDGVSVTESSFEIEKGEDGGGAKDSSPLTKIPLKPETEESNTAVLKAAAPAKSSASAEAELDYASLPSKAITVYTLDDGTATSASSFALENTKNSLLTKYDFSEKDSLIKKRIEYEIAYTDQEREAASIFAKAAGKGAAELEKALSSAGILYKKREVITEDFTSSYNALLRNLDDVKSKISASTTTGEVKALESQLIYFGDQLNAIYQNCQTVELKLR